MSQASSFFVNGRSAVFPSFEALRDALVAANVPRPWYVAVTELGECVAAYWAARFRCIHTSRTYANLLHERGGDLSADQVRLHAPTSDIQWQRVHRLPDASGEWVCLQPPASVQRAAASAWVARMHIVVPAAWRIRQLGSESRQPTLRMPAVGDAVAACMRDQEDGDYSTLFALLDNGLGRQMRDGTIARISGALESVGLPAIGRGACGHMVVEASANRTVDGLVCDDCFEDYRYAEDTGDYHRKDELHYHEDIGAWYTYPEDDPPNRRSGEDSDCVLDYSTDVLAHVSKDDSFTSSPTGDFHMGVELETMLTDGDADEKVYDVRRELGRDYIVGKHDGSLAYNGYPGIEFVTRPTSLRVHVDKFGGWTYTIGDLIAWKAGCCGMHVHVDANAFTKATLGKMIQFYNARDNTDFIRRIAGRHPDIDTQAQHYAARDTADYNTHHPVIALKGKPGGARYTMINLTNLGRRQSERLGVTPRQSGASNTVEIRIFRASLRKERLLAQLEFTHALIMYCRVAGFREMKHVHFTSWLAKYSDYPNLRKFLTLAPHKHGKPRNAAVGLTEEDAVAA